MKILVSFGTRPEAIKMAPIIFELQKRKIPFQVCVTAQHRELLDQVLSFFEIQPDFDLGVMKTNQSLNLLNSQILSLIDKILEKEKPDLILVHGDTNSSAMVALAGFQRKIKIGHIEAGLRTNNKMSPFPEEINRQITARIADFHFAPTQENRNNLVKEGIPTRQIFVTGNTVIDSIFWAMNKLSTMAENDEIINIKKLINPNKKTILLTGHRRENFGEGLKNICDAIRVISERDDVQTVYPVHLNPNVKEPVSKFLKGLPNVHLISPVSYPTMLWLYQQSKLVISDSGGVQEELPFFKKTLLVTREVSERMEGIKGGFSILVGTEKWKIIKNANYLLDNSTNYDGRENPFGDGLTAEKIISIILKEENYFKL